MRIVCHNGRSYGPLANSCSASYQLLGSRYRQHGSTCQIWDARAKEQVPGASFKWGHQKQLCNDRIRRQVFDPQYYSISHAVLTFCVVASSDATNLHNTQATWLSSSTLSLSGHKWWISGAGDPRTSVHIVLAVTDPNNPSAYKRHSLLLVEPTQKGVKIVRPMMVMGYDDAPEGHCEVVYDNVQVDLVKGIVGGKEGLGRGFEMLQARLG